MSSAGARNNKLWPPTEMFKMCRWPPHEYMLQDEWTPRHVCQLSREHPANYTKCEAYVGRATRLEERRLAQKPKTKYVQAPPPTRNAWDKNRNSTSKELRDFPPLPNNIKVNPWPQSQTRRANEDYSQQSRGMDDFLALNTEFQEWNSMVNIAALIRAVRDLNS